MKTILAATVSNYVCTSLSSSLFINHGFPANAQNTVCKPKQEKWSTGFSVIEGGSGAGALHRLLQSTPESFSDFIQNDSMPSAIEIWQYIKAYLITHAHFGEHPTLSTVSSHMLTSCSKRSHICKHSWVFHVTSIHHRHQTCCTPPGSCALSRYCPS